MHSLAVLHLFCRQKSPHQYKEESLSKAKDVAEDWFLQLRGKLRSGEIKTEKTFREASEQFLREYDIITQGQRSKVYIRGQHSRSQVHLVPFFGAMGLSEITAGKVQEYRIHRHEETQAKRGKPPETAGAQHHASGNRYSSPDPENRRPSRLA
jgi:hypothetical protein